MILLSRFPNLLKNLEEDLEDLFLLDLIDSTLMRLESEPPSSMLFGDTSNAKGEKEEDPQIMKTLEMEEVTLLMMGLIERVSRTMSPFPRPETLNQ